MSRSDIRNALEGDLDGEVYLKAGDFANLADLNADAVVNVLNFVIVSNGFGMDAPDINREGVVNTLDLVVAAKAFNR